jgi:virginiamycin B lyase
MVRWRWMTKTLGMLRSSILGRWLLTAVFLTDPAFASTALQGRVVGVNDGRGIEHASVTVTLPSGTSGPRAVTVFTGVDGAFELPVELPRDLPGAAFKAQKLGYRQVSQVGAQPAAAGALLFMEPVSNIAGQVPASAWFAALPRDKLRNIVITSCSSCHQMPSARVRDYADKIEAVSGGPQGTARAIDEWRKVVRHEAWRVVVRYMRAKHFAVFPLESVVSLDSVDWSTAQNANYNFFSEQQGELIARYLARNFPRSTASMPRDAYSPGAELGVSKSTVIREYEFPKDALVRELVPVAGSKFLWGADVRRNLIVRLDPDDGSTRWFPVDFKGSTGPHTIVPDDDGNVWVSMVDNDQFGRFEPATEHWTLWTLRPTDLPAGAAMASAAIVHDMSIDSRGRLARDPRGNVWLTMVGTNQLGTLNPDTGKVAFHDTSRIDGLSPINHLIYSTVLSADGQCAWYSQVNGSVGCLDTTTHKLRRLLRFEAGTGPRRMSRDNQGNLWVALFGSGQVARIDTASGTLTKTFDLPDRAAAPYSVTWDERRRAVWVATANSDAIYRLDPVSGSVRIYPLPRRMAYLRQIAIDETNGRLVASYGNYPEGSGPSMGVVIDVGD